MTTTPRAEHPKPQFVREDWLNLNGTWQFAMDFGVSGLEQGWHQDPTALTDRIVVPFCPESTLSGIGHTDFIPCVWYSRQVNLPQNWHSRRVFLHFGAVDFDCRAWVNGTLVGRHYGGSASFCFEITKALQPGENTVTVCALDDIRSNLQPAGKQCPGFHSRGCLYTRVTGIWQTVWLEARPAAFIDAVRVTPDTESGVFAFTPTFDSVSSDALFRVTVLADGREVGRAECPAQNGVPMRIRLESPRLWSPDDPFLYDVTYQLMVDDAVVDEVNSYAGLRSIRVEGHRLLLNGKPLFVRFVLDQGFYPDGIWTAPSDAALKADIELSMAVGFNGARLHQKVFEERFHFWADRLGYLTWGEYTDWGPGRNFVNPQLRCNMLTEWRECVMRDVNHPSIIAWTPTNETHPAAAADAENHRRFLQALADLTRDLDPTRPVNDASGYVHVDTDIYTVHNYNQDVDKFRQEYAALGPSATEGFQVNFPDLTARYEGQPFVVDEYGGTWWVPIERRAPETGSDRKKSWGYGNAPQSIEEVYERIEGLTKALTDHPFVAGFTYTQLTDVEQEQNGIYTYDRVPKFDPERLRRAFGAPAAMEEQG